MPSIDDPAEPQPVDTMLHAATVVRLDCATNALLNLLAEMGEAFDRRDLPTDLRQAMNDARDAISIARGELNIQPERIRSQSMSVRSANSILADYPRRIVDAHIAADNRARKPRTR